MAGFGQKQSLTETMPNVRFQIRKPIPVTITGGRFMSFDGETRRVPKRALLRPLVAASETGRLKVAKGLREAEALQRELQAFQRRITESGNSAFEGVGAHDDLVIAAALVCWWAEKSGRASDAA